MMSSQLNLPAELALTPLRYPKLWLALGVFFVLVVVVASVIDLKPVGDVLIQDKLMHLLVYGFLMGWFSQIYPSNVARLLQAIALITLGIGMEFMQGLVAFRQFETMDMFANAFGVLIAWGLSYTWMGKILFWFEKLFKE